MPWWDTWDSDWADYPEVLEDMRIMGEQAKQAALDRRKSENNLEFSVAEAEKAKMRLHEFGLWTTTALGPKILFRIVEKVERYQFEEARAILVARCDSNFIEHQLIKTWQPIIAFHGRSTVFQEALFAHRNAKYASAIYTLTPQIEGVISDWISGLENQNLETQFSKKIDQFYSLLKNIPAGNFYLEKTIASMYEFLKDGPPTQNFKSWLDVIDTSFPGRHAVTHGKYSNDMFTEENSIKLFLFLDTICDFMMIYESAVLGRDFSQ